MIRISIFFVAAKSDESRHFSPGLNCSRFTFKTVQKYTYLFFLKRIKFFLKMYRLRCNLPCQRHVKLQNRKPSKGAGSSFIRLETRSGAKSRSGILDSPTLTWVLGWHPVRGANERDNTVCKIVWFCIKVSFSNSWSTPKPHICDFANEHMIPCFCTDRCCHQWCSRSVVRVYTLTVIKCNGDTQVCPMVVTPCHFEGDSSMLYINLSFLVKI